MNCPICNREQCWGGNVCANVSNNISRAIPVQTKNLYKNLYPFLTEKQINDEIKFFEETLEESKRISLESSNSQKYLRGWLMRANEEAKREKTFMDRLSSYNAGKIMSDNVYGKGY
jgi:hypothetical protein